jgi:hypothetical protein
MQATCEKAEIVVKEFLDGESVNAFELGYFLYFFRSAYVACVELTKDEEVDLATIGNVRRSDLISVINKKVSYLWMEELDPDIDLEFIEISKNSPLKFVAKTAGGCLVALTLAVILSGGKANVYTGEFELPPMAEGIRALKEAFEQPQPLPHSLPSERKAAIINQTLGPKENG